MTRCEIKSHQAPKLKARFSPQKTELSREGILNNKINYNTQIITHTNNKKWLQ
jgi:hypothetical protein